MSDVMMAFADSNKGNTRIYQFGVDTAAYQELERSSEYRWAQKAVVGGKPHSDSVGPGLDSVEFNGVIYPHYRGGLGQIDSLRSIQSQGKPVRWVDGLGKDRGLWVIKRIVESESHYFTRGVPLKIEFRISLEEYAGGYLPH